MFPLDSQQSLLITTAHHSPPASTTTKNGFIDLNTSLSSTPRAQDPIRLLSNAQLACQCPFRPTQPLVQHAEPALLPIHFLPQDPRSLSSHLTHTHTHTPCLIHGSLHTLLTLRFFGFPCHLSSLLQPYNHSPVLTPSGSFIYSFFKKKSRLLKPPFYFSPLLHLSAFPTVLERP